MAQPCSATEESDTVDLQQCSATENGTRENGDSSIASKRSRDPTNIKEQQ